jgi:hypothetical protein
VPESVIVLRDGRDVACSIKARSENFDDGARRWLEDNQHALEFFERPDVRVIRYEDLIEDFSGTLVSLLEFLGLENEPAMAHFESAQLPFQQKRLRPGLMASLYRPIYKSSHQKRRSKQIHQSLFDGRGQWAERMSESEKVRFKEIAGPMLIELGYARDDSW